MFFTTLTYAQGSTEPQLTPAQTVSTTATLPPPPSSSPLPSPVSEKVPEGVFDYNKCLKTALTDNFSIRRAEERIRQQYGVVVQARASFLPSVDVTGVITKKDRALIPSFGGDTFGSNRDWNVRVLVTQSIFSGGKGTANYYRARALEDAARHDFEAVVNDTLLDVKTKYFNVLLSREQLKVQEANIKLLEEELRLEDNKLQAGTVSQFNVLRAEVALANSKAPYIRAKNQIRIALEELSESLGIKSTGTQIDEPPLIVVGALDATPFDISLENAIKNAEAQRPELLRLEKSVEAETYAIRLARGDYLPSLSVEGGYGAEKSAFSDNLSDELRGWNLGARANWNLFDGLATSGRVTEAQAQRLIQRVSLSEQKVKVSVEVRQAYASLREATELVAASKKVVEQAQESLRLASARFSSGSSAQIDVLDSQVALTEARTNEIQALYDYNVARASLERAIGTKFEKVS